MSMLISNSNVNQTETVFQPYGTSVTPIVTISSPGQGSPAGFTLQGIAGIYGGANNLQVGDAAGNPAQIYASAVVMGNANVGDVIYNASGITLQQAQTGTSEAFVSFNSNAATNAMALSNVSSINGSAFTSLQAGRLNISTAGAHTVTLAQPYSSYSSFSITANATSTNVVTVSTLTATSFQLSWAGNTSGTINWITAGVTQ